MRLKKEGVYPLSKDSISFSKDFHYAIADAPCYRVNDTRYYVEMVAGKWRPRWYNSVLDGEFKTRREAAEFVLKIGEVPRVEDVERVTREYVLHRGCLIPGSVCDVCDKTAHTDNIAFVRLSGVETYACNECRNEPSEV